MELSKFMAIFFKKADLDESFQNRNLKILDPTGTGHVRLRLDWDIGIAPSEIP